MDLGMAIRLFRQVIHAVRKIFHVGDTNRNGRSALKRHTSHGFLA